MSSARKITALVSELRGDLCIVNSAIRKISAHDDTLDVDAIATLLHSGLMEGDRSPSPNPNGNGRDKNILDKLE